MAGSIPQQALHNALVQEKRRQTGEMERSSKEVLLDEEGIALDDLSHQRSPTTAGIGPEQQRPTNLQAQFQSSTNVAQQGWRRGNATDDLSRRESTNVLAMGKLYQRMGKMSIIPRYILYILPLGILIAVPIVIGALIPKLELGVSLHPLICLDETDCRACEFCGFSYGSKSSGYPSGSPKYSPNSSPSSSNTSSASSPPAPQNMQPLFQHSKSPTVSSHGHSYPSSLLSPS